MARNIEIKARATNIDAQEKIAAAQSDTVLEVLHQKDIFYATPQGRLKLRIFTPHQAQLIAYHRDDLRGLKTSHYEIYDTTNPEQLDNTLSTFPGRRGEVIKTRHLYRVGQTRIHIDWVQGLGEFLELEVVMGEDQSMEEGQSKARHLMDLLNIKDEDLVAKAYIDLLEGL